MQPLQGRTIALLESRKSDEIAALVRRLGGTPLSAPTVREVAGAEDLAATAERLAGRHFGLAVFLTGAGATALFEDADRRGRLSLVVDALRETQVAVRGPKPLAVLRRYGVVPAATTVKPHTSKELIDAIDALPGTIEGMAALLVHYGERSVDVAAALQARGAVLEEVCPYAWALPEDTAPIASVIQAAIAGRLDAMLFTSQVQCRHLLRVAADIGVVDNLTSTLNADVVVGAIGPVCAEALRQAGVTPDVIPAAPNMASLITAIGDYFELTEA
jgi:uroporphyrinogen-III synthase